MRTTRVLAIIAILGIAFSFRASAKVVYDSETTNKWFSVDMSTLKTEDLKAPRWTPPSAGGEAKVEQAVIKLDTDLDDPLTYTAEQSSESVAIVAAEMTATVNASVPELKDVPQAALCVIGTASATNWVGLVGNGNGGTEWVTFTTPVPVAGKIYSVRIEFDQRQGQRKIRYLVGGVVLLGEGSSDGWYLNPQSGAAKISNVSFSGTGDIKALGGENITENTFEFVDPTETAGYDFTNGSFSVGAEIQGYTGVKATLTVVDFTGKQKPLGEKDLSSGQAPVQWDLTELEAGGFYDYTVEVKVGDQVIDTLSGTFYAANWPADIWFGADATGGSDNVTNGAWVSTAKPNVENNAYTIDDEAIFNVDSDVQSKGVDHVTRVDAAVTFDALVANPARPEGDAFGGFVAAQDGWRALTKNGWSLLHGDVAPETGVPYVIRAEVDFHTGGRGVRYFVAMSAEPTDADFVPLYDANDNQWIQLAVSATTLQKVELQGSGKVAKFEATVADKALAVVDGREYDTMAEALETAGTNGEHAVTLLTNATIDPTKPGSYDIAPGGHHYMSGGTVSTDTSNTKTIVITEPGQPPVVRPSTEEMKKVTTPAGKSYKNINSLRDFLERNGVAAYMEDLGYEAITGEMDVVPTGSKNNLPLWEDYVMGIEPEDSVDPVTTPAGDTATDGITLAIPAIAAGKPSGDYDLVFKVLDAQNAAKTTTDDANDIKIPLATGKYKVKVIFAEPVSK